MADEVVVKKEEDWMQKKWRPAMGWMYMVICMLDMAIFPVLWSLLQVLTKQPITQWSPLTLQGAGLFHLAMGAVLGITAWGRTQEKVSGTSSNYGPSNYSATPAPSLTPYSQTVSTTFAPATESTGDFSNPTPTPVVRRPVVRPNLD
jgi:hypothetical protein